MKKQKYVKLTPDMIPSDLDLRPMLNKDITPKLFGWKTFRGMIAMLRRLNKMCIEKEMKVRYTIDLPIKW